MTPGFRALSPAQSHVCDVIRFLAAVAVALHHTLDHLEYEPYYNLSRAFHANLGSLGVAIFFLLSGFLIAHTVGRKASRGDYTIREYVVERTTRIYLVYLPAILLALSVVAIARGSLFTTPDTSFPRLLVQVFMLQGVAPFSGHAETLALLGPSWTLTYEFWLYLLFGLGALPTRAAASIPAGIALIVVAGLYMTLNHAGLMATTWLAGAGIAYLFQRVSLPPAPGIVLALATFAGAGALRAMAGASAAADIWLTTGAYVVAFGLLMLSLGGVSGGVRERGSLAQRLAGYSYSLYLTHMVWLFLIGAWFDGPLDQLVARWGHLPVAVLVLLAVNVAAALFAQLTEAHNERVRRAVLRWLARSPAPRTVPAIQQVELS